MTKKDLAKKYVEYGYSTSLADAREQIDNFIDVVGKALQTGEDVNINGFLNFKIVDKAARWFKDPRTQEDKLADAGRKIRIKQTPAFKALAGGDQ